MYKIYYKILVIILIIFMVSCKSKVEISQIKSDEADSLYSENKIEEANKSYIKALKINSENINALLGLAKISEHNGNENEAAEYYNKIIEIDSYNDDAIIKLANYYKKTEVIKAIELLKNGSSEESDSLLKELLQNELDKLTNKPFVELDINKFYEYSTFYNNSNDIENNAYACYNLLKIVENEKSKDDKTNEIKTFLTKKINTLYVEVDPDSIYTIAGGYQLAVSSGRLSVESFEEASRNYLSMEMQIESIYTAMGKKSDILPGNAREIRQKIFYYSMLTRMYEDIFSEKRYK